MNNDTSQADDTELADSQHSTPVYPLAGVLLAGGILRRDGSLEPSVTIPPPARPKPEKSVREQKRTTAGPEAPISSTD